jgi:MtrB/PioB family decaheme-associated outer membrane protein
MYDRGGESMKSIILVLVLIFSLIPLLNASAEEQKISGEAVVTGQLLNINGNKAKFNQYRDIRDGFTGSAHFQYEKEAWYTDFLATEVGRKDQSYELFGGKWGTFKYDLKYDQIPHNFTYNAKSFYSGIGGANLSYPTQPPTTNFGAWNTFDYSLERSSLAAGFKFDLLKPFFFDASVSQIKKTGVYPIGAAGTNPGGISIELPAPIEYITDTVKVAAGYVQNPLSLSLNYMYGTFKNQNSLLNFRNPATDNTAATTDTFFEAPNNNFYKLAFQGAVKLPFNSKFNADLAYSQLSSSEILLNSYVANVTAAASNIGQQGRTGITLSNYVFNGKADIQNYNLILTSNPFYFLDGKLFFRYYRRNNKSDEITTTDPTASPISFTNEPFGYRNTATGAQLGFKLPASFYLSGGYTWAEIRRDGREDIPENIDQTYDIGLRWSGVDFMVAKAAYQRLHRTADFVPPVVTSPTDVVIIENYVRRYDAAAKDQDTYKASLEFFPIENLNFNLGYRYIYTNYEDTILGLRGATRNIIDLDAEYLFMKRARLFGYADYEYVKFQQYQRQLPSPTTAFNPSLPPTTTAFNWTACQTEKNYSYGLGTDLYILPKKLTLRLQTNYYKADGYVDYSYLLGNNPLPPGQTNSNIDISNWDNYRINNYIIKAIYDLTRSLSLIGGWAYEKYTYDDAQFNGYQYVTSTAFLTGAYSNQNYRANVYYLSAAYKF